MEHIRADGCRSSPGNFASYHVYPYYPRLSAAMISSPAVMDDTPDLGTASAVISRAGDRDCGERPIQRAA
ncbi:MAG: hypothetical protein ACLUEU_13645 [Oscillospiraceae bacterium]